MKIKKLIKKLKEYKKNHGNCEIMFKGDEVCVRKGYNADKDFILFHYITTNYGRKLHLFQGDGKGFDLNNIEKEPIDLKTRFPG